MGIIVDHVAKSKTQDNVRSGTHSAGFSKALDGGVHVASEDFSDVTNDES